MKKKNTADINKYPLYGHFFLKKKLRLLSWQFLLNAVPKTNK